MLCVLRPAYKDEFNISDNSVTEDRTSSKSAYCSLLCLCLFTYTRCGGNVTSLKTQFDDRLQHLMW